MPEALLSIIQIQMGKRKFLYSLAIFTAFSLLYFASPEIMSLYTAARRMDTPGRFYQVPILCFHNLDGLGRYSLRRSDFRAFLERIKSEGLQVISLKTLVETHKKGRLLDYPSIVITMDDDYTNIVRVAAPLLREYRYPATLFVYAEAIRQEPRMGISWDDLTRLHEEGFDIQNHSYTHTAFHKPAQNESMQSYGYRVHRETVLSREALETKIPGLKIYAFAFPFGYFSPFLKERLISLGYTVMLTTDARPANLLEPFNGTYDRFTIEDEAHMNSAWYLHALAAMARKTPETSLPPAIPQEKSGEIR